MGRRAGMTSVCAVVLADHLKYSFLGSLYIAILFAGLIFATIFSTHVRKKWKEMREFLCSTAYAREAGYRPDSLRRYRFWF